MTRKKQFNKLQYLFVKLSAEDKKILQDFSTAQGYSNLSEFVRRELLNMAKRSIESTRESNHGN